MTPADEALALESLTVFCSNAIALVRAARPWMPVGIGKWITYSWGVRGRMLRGGRA